MDLQRIVREVDIDTLQSQLENVAYGKLDEQDLRYMTDEHIIKLFNVAQLTVEYLLYAQEQLAGSLHSLATKYSDKKRYSNLCLLYSMFPLYYPIISLSQ